MIGFGVSIWQAVTTLISGGGGPAGRAFAETDYVPTLAL